MKREISGLILRLISLLFATVPVTLATLSYFPIWRKAGALTMLSGFTLLLLLLSIMPIIKLFRRFFSSPSATTMWFIIFLIFFALSKIADQMVVISFVGYLGNLFAAFIWKLSGRIRNEG